ncbi:unnamed protein product [Lactuca virosa]|uniref:Uncharacterized protein n=1 Tax=Lactuca virosa TaxID=75947 RepID=A0AAU9N872_9ASTR|nr:unnamed protein product [Lactuca virosa]
MGQMVTIYSFCGFITDEGLPELREALTKKLREENKLTKSSVMVTTGANRMFGMNIIITTSIAMFVSRNRNEKLITRPTVFTVID